MGGHQWQSRHQSITLAQAQHVFWDGVRKCYALLAQHNDALQVERYDEPLAIRVTNHRYTCLAGVTPKPQVERYDAYSYGYETDFTVCVVRSSCQNHR